MGDRLCHLLFSSPGPGGKFLALVPLCLGVGSLWVQRKRPWGSTWDVGSRQEALIEFTSLSRGLELQPGHAACAELLGARWKTLWVPGLAGWRWVSCYSFSSRPPPTEYAGPHICPGSQSQGWGGVARSRGKPHFGKCLLDGLFEMGEGCPVPHNEGNDQCAT